MKAKVALFVNGWNGENIDNFLDGFNSFFSNDDVDLFVFTSYSTNAGIMEAQHGAENSIYSLPDVSFFDAVIIYGAGIKSESVIIDIINKSKEAGVPVVLQGVDSDEVSSVTVDNYVGMKDLCEHLVEKHDVKDVIYIAGTEDNTDSNFRMEVLKETLEAHGHRLKTKNIYYANWEAGQIKEYLEENYSEDKSKLPDAFVCANDQMAMYVVLFLEQMGYRIPDDIIVTGFDNLSDGKVCYPSLATVDQGYKEQGSECAKFVEELLNNKRMIKKSIIPCTAMPGESCGCMECNGEMELRKKIGRLWWTERYISENVRIRELQLDMCFTSNERFENIHQSMNEDFLTSTSEETEDFHIYLNPQYKELVYMNMQEADNQETYFSSVMDVICARTGGTIYPENTLDITKLLLGYTVDDKSKTYIFKSLMIDDVVVGYLVMGYTKSAFKERKYYEFSENVGKTLKKYQKIIDDYNKTIRIQEQANEFLRQTVGALATAVDAKDSYTNGHSHRVAKYARKIAEESGMTEAECEDVYLAGLLHDVGKIGIDDRIINKEGKLTDEEFAVIKLHPVLGGQILSKIMMSPSLSVGARYHHERYDGNGYPEKLKGEDIPRIARIIAVADAYDAMTSRRSYRDMMPQLAVREEILKGMGTQFDSEYAGIMLRLLDKDEAYTMKESRAKEALGAGLSYAFEDNKIKVSAGIRITDCPVSIKIRYAPLRNGGNPTLLFYDSADEKYYPEGSQGAGEMDFVKFVGIDMNGTVHQDYVRKVSHNSKGKEPIKKEKGKTCTANLFVVKQEDHFLVRITTDERTDEMTVAMYDASRYLYLALTGEYCTLDILAVDIASNAIESDYIPRIAKKVTYTDGPVGDIPNIQIDGWLANRSEILRLDSDVTIEFHTMSLPSAGRVWHCPLVAMFSSDDGEIGGSNFRELAFIRLEGEVWCDNPEVSNETSVLKSEAFENWSAWKQKNKAGVNCSLQISRKGNVIKLQVENSGLEIRNITTMPTDVSNVYFYLSGDQCALTNIRINK